MLYRNCGNDQHHPQHGGNASLFSFEVRPRCLLGILLETDKSSSLISLYCWLLTFRNVGRGCEFYSMLPMNLFISPLFCQYWLLKVKLLFIPATNCLIFERVIGKCKVINKLVKIKESLMGLHFIWGLLRRNHEIPSLCFSVFLFLRQHFVM